MNLVSRLFLVSVFLLTCAGAINAQISIGASDLHYIPGIDVTRQTSLDLIEVDLGESGANRSWDFSGIELPVEYIEHLRDTEGQPGAEAFPTANICMFMDPNPDFWLVITYANINENNANFLGMAADIPQMDTIITNAVENEGNAYNFPVRYGDAWDLVRTSDFNGELSIDSVHFVADAWGTITDVMGTFDCLRIQRFTNSTQQDGDEVTVETDWAYIWIVPEYGEIVTIDSEDNEENPDFTSGEFSRVISYEITGVAGSHKPGLPTQSCLEPAFPNPFNPQTNLRFTVAQPGFVTLDVYDLSGRLVSQVKSGFFKTGTYQTTFNAIDLNSGVYLVKLSANGITQSQRLVLVK